MRVQRGRVLEATHVVGQKERKRAVLLWTAAVLLMLVPLPFVPLLREVLQSRLQDAGVGNTEVGAELGTSIWLFVGTLAACVYVAGNQTRKPMQAQKRILALMVSMLFLAACYLVYNVLQYLRVLQGS